MICDGIEDIDMLDRYKQTEFYSNIVNVLGLCELPIF